MENSTKIPIFILKLVGFWNYQICNKKSLNFLYFAYKIFSIFLFLVGIDYFVKATINFQNGGLENYFFNMAIVVAFFLVILINLEGLSGRNEWEIILQEFQEIEKISVQHNFKIRKLSNGRKFMILLPVFLYIGNVLVSQQFDLMFVPKIYVFLAMFFTTYMVTVFLMIYCWNVKNLYKNLMKIQKSFDISTCMQMFKQISSVNGRMHKFSMFRVSAVMGNSKKLNLKS